MVIGGTEIAKIQMFARNTQSQKLCLFSYLYAYVSHRERESVRVLDLFVPELPALQRSGKKGLTQERAGSPSRLNFFVKLAAVLFACVTWRGYDVRDSEHSR